MTPDAMKKKMKKNSKLRTRVRWFMLGQRRCHCCGVQLQWDTNKPQSASVEHMVPKSKGGKMHNENTIVVCRNCNSDRGNACWIDWVIVNNFPKKEWLINRYIKAVEFYKESNEFKLHKDIYQKVEVYNELRVSNN